MGQSPTMSCLFVVPFSLLAIAGLFGCGRVEDNPPPQCSERACTVEDGEFLRTVVDGRYDEAWLYFDFESADAFDVDNPADSNAWDIAIRRVVVKSNGGVSGRGGVEVAVIDDEDFAAITTAPRVGWEQDQAGDDEERDPGGTVFNETTWYDYDLLTHSVEPKDQFYVIRTVEGATFKIRFDSYYSADGEAGWLSFAWGAVAPF